LVKILDSRVFWERGGESRPRQLDRVFRIASFGGCPASLVPHHFQFHVPTLSEPKSPKNAFSFVNDIPCEASISRTEPRQNHLVNFQDTRVPADAVSFCLASKPGPHAKAGQNQNAARFIPLLLRRNDARSHLGAQHEAQDRVTNSRERQLQAVGDSVHT